MFVRVYDKTQNRYYKSLVYAKVDVGYSLRYVVLNPYTEEFTLVDYLDKSCNPPIPLVETIEKDEIGFKTYSNAELLKYKYYCKTQNQFVEIPKSLIGYPDVCENYPFLLDVIEHHNVPVSRYEIQLRELQDKDQWNYLLTQQDADDFMKLFAGFHDSYLTKLFYTEEAGYTNATVTFDNSGWYGIVELCFEGIQTLHMRPAIENYDNFIYDATLLIQDDSVFWADSANVQFKDATYDGSYIAALNLKWRKIHSD